MYAPTSRKPASALLSVLLIMSVMSGIVLLASQHAINSTRVANATSDSSSAYQSALSGIEEGLLFVRNNETNGKILGESANQYEITEAHRRGFKKNTDCAQEAALTKVSSSATDLGCPFYDIAVRRFVHIKSGAIFRLTASDLPLGKPVSMTVRSPKGEISASIPENGGGGEVLVQFYNSSNAKISEGTVRAGTSVPFNQGAVRIVMEARSELGIQTINLNPGSGMSYVLERPTILIEATGYAGPVERRLLMGVSKADFSKKTLLDFSGSFDSDGLLK